MREYGGAVVGTTINHYCYINCRYLPPFFEHNYRIAYSETEMIKTIDEIKHPVVKAVLNYLDFRGQGVEVHHHGDLPARSGLGSSSSFTSGLLNAMLALKGIQLPKKELAELAIYIEQEVLDEVVGSQDQILTTYGGFNRIDFDRSGSFMVSPVIASQARIELLHSHLMLFFTGFSRFASVVARSQVANFGKKTEVLQRMRSMVDEGLDIIQNERRDLCDFGELLHESWMCKRGLSEKVSNEAIDALYERARMGGAIGGKLLGAGGGGFMVLFVPVEKQQKVRESLSDLLHIPFSFEKEGSRIIVYEPSGVVIHV